MGIFLLTKGLQKRFSDSPEIFAAVQFGQAGKTRNLLVDAKQVAIELDNELVSQLEEFFKTADTTAPFGTLANPQPNY
jgi:hypothetical protein